LDKDTSYVVVNVEGKKVVGEERASDLIVREGVQLSYVVDVDREKCWRKNASLANSSLYIEKIGHISIHFHIKLASK
jgi:hypothetical protein